MSGPAIILDTETTDKDDEKHKGMPLDELVDFDPGYVDWMMRQDWLDPYLRKGLELAGERA